MNGEFARGWRIVTAGTIGIAAGASSLFFYSQGVFLKPLAEAYGWTRGEASLGSLVGTACAALMSIPMGRLVDRIGSSRVAVGSLIALALSFAAMGAFIGDLTTFLVLTGMLSLATSGSSPLPYTRLIIGTFERRRGLAVGIALAGTGLGAILAPAVLTPLVAVQGWRTGYYVLAGIALVACVTVGLMLRGGESASVRATPAPLRSIVGDPAFLAIGVPILLGSAAVLGSVVHFVPLLTDGGLAPAKAGATAAVIGLSAIVGRLLVGVLLDRIAPAAVAIGLFALAATGAIMLALNGVAYALPAALVLGLSVGAEGNLIAVLTGRHFAAARYGQAYGALYALFLVGGALGPTVIGFLFDSATGYRTAMYVAAGALAIASLAACRLIRLAPVSIPTLS
ncbi:MAG: major facilitator superfamily 1 [Bradyrhizobium sp.]|nr:major facilitator superfamily 1 [Bradyrhizobium sp.]